MTLEDRRALASLASIPGYRVLLTHLVQSKREPSLDRLKTAKTRDEIADSAMEFRIWDSVLKELENLPKQAVQELKEEGDSIYG